MANINRKIAEELGVREQQVEATVTLLDGGATVPFVARYRKEITGGLDDARIHLVNAAHQALSIVVEFLRVIVRGEQTHVAAFGAEPVAGDAAHGGGQRLRMRRLE